MFPKSINLFVITCCKDCKKRTQTCHSTCEVYLKQRKELDEKKAKFEKQKNYAGW